MCITCVGCSRYTQTNFDIRVNVESLVIKLVTRDSPIREKCYQYPFLQTAVGILLQHHWPIHWLFLRNATSWRPSKRKSLLHGCCLIQRVKNEVRQLSAYSVQWQSVFEWNSMIIKLIEKGICKLSWIAVTLWSKCSVIINSQVSDCEIFKLGMEYCGLD
jgi:hypothetical protein